MVFNSDTNHDDIVSDIQFWCGIDSTDTTTYPTTDISRNANRGLDRVTALILKSDNKWRHDDTANTSTEILDVTTNLASGTKKYALSITWLKIGMVRIKDVNGNWVTLIARDRNRLSDDQLNATSGSPVYYYRLGNWIYFDKAPNYVSSGGLEVQYQRGPSYFVPGDTTKTPGFASHFHRLISLYCSRDYLIKNQMGERLAQVRAEIGWPPDNNRAGSGMEGELCVHYSERNEDEQPSITTRYEDYGQASLGETTYNSPYGFLL